MMSLHILAGVLSLIAGAVALYAAKGKRAHVRWGQAFVIAMAVMSATGVLIAAYLRPNIGSMGIGMLTFYLIATGWSAVRFPVAAMRAWHFGAMLAVFALGLFLVRLGLEARLHVDGRVDLIPPQPLYFFGVVAICAAAFDARMLLAGRIEGAQRLIRHLWRLGLAMFIATTSFFIGQAKQFPMPIRQSGVLVIPVFLVIGVLVYWLVKLGWPRRKRNRSETPVVSPNASA